ncbi:MAG TPA: TetR/AcrR family transcriptional regulator [Bryobacteraceae bacterium]|nr:TetR/AcrR family transcriptional regulator [Bryobacteraceae bacterium]
MNHTKERILDTAEQLFAEHGYAATSLRSIIAQAGVNLAAVHYHFHSKQALLEAVVLRRSIPANHERLALLGRFEKEAGGNPPPLEKVIEAFVAPTLEMSRNPQSGSMVFMRLLGRLHAEGDLLPGIITSQFGDVLQRFGAALRAALPDLPREELLWRLNLAIGALSQTLRGGSKDLETISDLSLSLNSEAALERLVAFLSAGFRAPVPTHAIEESQVAVQEK